MPGVKLKQMRVVVWDHEDVIRSTRGDDCGLELAFGVCAITSALGPRAIKWHARRSASSGVDIASGVLGALSGGEHPSSAGSGESSPPQAGTNKEIARQRDRWIV